MLEGGEITDRIAFDGNAVSCTIGGKDMDTLYCCVYLGTDEQLQARERHSAIYKTELVRVAGRRDDPIEIFAQK